MSKFSTINVVKCKSCETLTVIRSQQKSFCCKRCGIRNKNEAIKQFTNADDAIEYIKEQNILNSNFKIEFRRLG
ncbi:MAG: DUF5817 domain-containing protein [Candidatus Helarchaeota archaeon]